jgi:hypothetical protein
MSKCNIKKYDALPGRVGLIDVDAARYGLGEAMKRVELIKQKLDKAVFLNKQKKHGKNM